MTAITAIKGRNATVRNAALAGVASCAYAESKARAELIAQLKATLGNKPSADEMTLAQREYVIGRTAQRLTDSDGVKGMDVAARIAFARKLVLSYAAPVKDGVKARPLRKGQEGRRTVAQDTVMRNAEKAWSLIKAEVLPTMSSAQTQKAKNAKQQRSPAMAGSTARGGKAETGITHSELVKPSGKMTRDDAVAYLNGMAATMLAFCNKHAGVVPTDYGTAVNAFKSAADKASIAHAATK